MNISLRNFTSNDLTIHEQWCNNIQAEQYMSRVAPSVYLQTGIMHSYLSVWYVILVDEQPVGILWFEKESMDDDAVQLGIMLGDEKYFGKGIGTTAMELGIEKAAIRLNFSKVQLNVRKSNKRAFAVYEKFGFKIIGEGIKETDETEDIPYYSMEYILPTSD
jgi:RimJ/RimL family protein N-acetyltransferase